jgi:hypothetical protein
MNLVHDLRGRGNPCHPVRIFRNDLRFHATALPAVLGERPLSRPVRLEGVHS